MSNIRPISDPAIATAMLATMQSIDSVRSAPSGISEPRWRILQCIAKAAPNVPTPAELRMCSGLNKAALAEHVQALQWKGLLEMGGYRLSPSAAAMVGLQQPYAPRDAKAMTFAEPELPSAQVAPSHKMDPADVPAYMRPDCTPLRSTNLSSSARPVGSPVQPPLSITAEQPAPSTGRRSGPESSSVSARAKAAPRTSIKPRPVGRVTVASAAPAPVIAAPVPANPKPQISTPPATPPKPTSWIEQRHARLAAAIAFLKARAILVTPTDRDAQIRTYRVSGKRYPQLAEEVVELAIEKGWAE